MFAVSILKKLTAFLLDGRVKMAKVYYKRDMKRWLKDANAVIKSDDFQESVFEEWGILHWDSRLRPCLVGKRSG